MAKANLDKQKKKLEGELKASQAQYEESQAANAAVQDSLRKKEAECLDLTANVEDLDAQLNGANKKVKDLTEKLSEQESETDSALYAKSKVEKAKAEALRQIEELNGKLEEANGATAASQVRTAINCIYTCSSWR